MALNESLVQPAIPGQLRVAIFEPLFFQSNERVRRRSKLCANGWRHCVDLFTTTAYSTNGRREVAVGRQQISCIVFISFSHNHHVYREHHIHCFLDQRSDALMTSSDRYQIMTNRLVNPNLQVRHMSEQFTRSLILDRPFLDTTKVRAYPVVCRLERCEKTPLCDVKRRISCLRNLTDVVASRLPLSWSDQLLRELTVVQSAHAFQAETLDRVIPIVAVNEDDRTIRHTIRHYWPP